MALTLFYPASAAPMAQRFEQWCELQSSEQPPHTMIASTRLADPAPHCLWLDDDGLALCSANHPTPFRLATKMLSQRTQGGSLLRQACGANLTGSTVLDPFAGFGMDGLLLQELGFQVTMVERHLAVFLMLEDFCEQLGVAAQVLNGEAQQYLAEANSYDIVFLDPMFPPRKKRALPNLGLQVLQDLTQGEELDLPHYLHLAQSCAKRRVVLKRRRRDPVLGRPSHQLKGKAVRFDVYL